MCALCRSIDEGRVLAAVALIQPTRVPVTAKRQDVEESSAAASKLSTSSSSSSSGLAGSSGSSLEGGKEEEEEESNNNYNQRGTPIHNRRKNLR